MPLALACDTDGRDMMAKHEGVVDVMDEGGFEADSLGVGEEETDEGLIWAGRVWRLWQDVGDSTASALAALAAYLEAAEPDEADGEGGVAAPERGDAASDPEGEAGRLGGVAG